MAKPRTSGTVSSIALLVISLAALGWTGYNLLPTIGTASKSSAAQKTMAKRLSSASARVWLGALGLEVDALSASGIDANGAGVILNDLQSYLDQNGDVFLAAVDAHNKAKKQADSDTRLIRAGRTPGADALAAHASTLSSTAASRNSLQAAALTAASSHLTDAQMTRLAMIRANAKHEVPAAYCLVARTDEQWVALREALAAERQASERGDSVAEAVSSLLSTVRSEGATATALASVSANAGAIANALQ